jgi:hypothetical protein
MFTALIFLFYPSRFLVSLQPFLFSQHFLPFSLLFSTLIKHKLALFALFELFR